MEDQTESGAATLRRKAELLGVNQATVHKFLEKEEDVSFDIVERLCLTMGGSLEFASATNGVAEEEKPKDRGSVETRRTQLLSVGMIHPRTYETQFYTEARLCPALPSLVPGHPACTEEVYGLSLNATDHRSSLCFIRLVREPDLVRDGTLVVLQPFASRAPNFLRRLRRIINKEGAVAHIIGEGLRPDQEFCVFQPGEVAIYAVAVGVLTDDPEAFGWQRRDGNGH
ncbi:MAG: hypothetical protein RLY93_18410 [Sumerlaeia bacterium]